MTLAGRRFFINDEKSNTHDSKATPNHSHWRWWILSRPGKSRAGKICDSPKRRGSCAGAFVPTASGEPDHYVASFYAAFLKLGCRPSVLTFFKRTPELRSFLLSQDVIYVGGGNTKTLLAVWRDWGVGEILREAWQSGVVLTGVSAGAICWFEQGLTDSFSDGLRPLACLGFLPGSCCRTTTVKPSAEPFYPQAARGR